MPSNSPSVATADDVVRLYRELLGRDPESPDVIQAHVNRPVLDVAIEIARSQEYCHRVRGDDLPQLRELVKAVFGAVTLADDWLEQFTTIINYHRIGIHDVIEYFLQILNQIEDRPWPAVTEPFGACTCADAFTVVVPTLNSASWIGELLQIYRDAGIDPLFAVDSRTTDGTESVLDGLNARFVGVASSAPRVESLMPALAASAPTTWVLRLDDDELPSGELLRWMSGLDLDSSINIYGFPRCQLMLEGRERLQRSRFIAFGPSVDFDRQWRLFRKDRVAFDERLHRPGIVVHRPGISIPKGAYAPDGALILHFDWIVRTHDRRLEKFERYRRQCDASARNLRHFGIWEDIPFSWHRFQPVQSERLTAFARKIEGKGC